MGSPALFRLQGKVVHSGPARADLPAADAAHGTSTGSPTSAQRREAIKLPVSSPGGGNPPVLPFGDSNSDMGGENEALTDVQDR